MPYTPSGFFCDRLIRERERRDGEGSLNKPLRFNSQDFSVLRQECLQRKTLFEDDSFPASVESLGFKELGHKSNKVKNIVWKRPKVGRGHGGGRWKIEPGRLNCCCGVKILSTCPTWIDWNKVIMQLYFLFLALYSRCFIICLFRDNCSHSQYLPNLSQSALQFAPQITPWNGGNRYSVD